MRRLLMGGCVLCLLACADVTGPGKPIDLGTKVGTPLTESSEALLSAPVWTPDGRALVFVKTTALSSPGVGAVVAVDAQTRSRRVLYEAPSFIAQSPAVSADGLSVFFLGKRDTSLTFAGLEAYRLPMAGGTPELLPGLGAALSIAVSPDSQHLVYQPVGAGTRPPLTAYDLRDGSTLALAQGTVLAFSPDGRDLLYQDWGAVGFGTVSLDDAVEQPVDMGLEPNDYLRASRWDAAGIHLLFNRLERAGPDFYVRDVGTGLIREVYQESFDGIMDPLVGWSPGGERVAFWVWKCLEYTGLFSCGHSHSALYVVDLRSGEETWIAGGPKEGGGISFSPDGRRVLYFYGHGWFLSNVN